jgi:hypothetical protein
MRLERSTTSQLSSGSTWILDPAVAASGRSPASTARPLRGRYAGPLVIALFHELDNGDESRAEPEVCRPEQEGD